MSAPGDISRVYHFVPLVDVESCMRPACTCSAHSNLGGRGLPRFSARWRMPRQARWLKKYLGGGCASKIRHKEDARPALGDAPVLRVQGAPSQGGSVSHNGPSRVPLPARRSRHCTGRRRDPHGFFQDDSEVLAACRTEGSRHVLPHHESWANKLSWPLSMLIHLPHFSNETYLF